MGAWGANRAMHINVRVCIGKTAGQFEPEPPLSLEANSLRIKSAPVVLLTNPQILPHLGRVVLTSRREFRPLYSLLFFIVASCWLITRLLLVALVTSWCPPFFHPPD